MATVNKNFRVKNGLVVEGTTATVNGFDILTKADADQTYIINLIGGTATSENTANAVVKRDGNGDFAAGVITANRINFGESGYIEDDGDGDINIVATGDDVRINADDVRLNAVDDVWINSGSDGSVDGDIILHTNGGEIRLESNDVFLGFSTNNEDRVATQGYVDSAESDAVSTANSYTDGQLQSYTPTSSLDSTIDGFGYLKSADLAGYATESYADTAASNAQSAAESFATNAANNAQAEAEDYTDLQLQSYTPTSQLDSVVDNLGYLKSADLAGYATESYADTAASNAQSAAEDYADGVVNNLDTDDIEEGASNLYFTNGRARNAMGAGTGLSYDSSTGTFSVTANTFDNWGAASAAEAAANTYTDNAIDDLNADDIEEGSVNLYFTQGRARGSLSAGTGVSYDSDTGVISVNTNSIATQDYVDTAVSNLVDSAPELLNTLNELAAAIGDDENFVATVTTQIGEKVAKAGDTMTGALVLHADPVNALEAATKQYVDAAQTAAEQSAQVELETAIDNLQDGTSDFTAVDINSVSRQVAATTGNIPTAETETTALSWSKNEYRTAKVLVKAKNGSHTHASEILLTLDTSDNINITEYAITTTNGSLVDISADISGTDVRLRVTPAHNNTEVMAHATLLV